MSRDASQKSFLHGNGGNLTHEMHNLVLLHDQIGCDLFIFDYRGHAKSSNITPTQTGLIQDTISAIKQLKVIKNDSNLKPIIFGRSLGGAIVFHSILPMIKEHGINIENSLSSAWDAIGNNFLYPLIVDKWNNMQCIDELREHNLIDIPILFISGRSDTVLDPVMMDNLFGYCKEEGCFSNVAWKEFELGDHNDTYLCDGYTNCVEAFIDSVALL